VRQSASHLFRIGKRPFTSRERTTPTALFGNVVTDLRAGGQRRGLMRITAQTYWPVKSARCVTNVCTCTNSRFNPVRAGCLRTLHAGRDGGNHHKVPKIRFWMIGFERLRHTRRPSVTESSARMLGKDSSEIFKGGSPPSKCMLDIPIPMT